MSRLRGIKARFALPASSGMTGNDTWPIFSQPLPGLCTLRSAAPRSRRLSSEFPPAGKQITLEACLWYPLPLYAPAEDEREVDGRAPSPLRGEGRGEGDTGKALRCSR